MSFRFCLLGTASLAACAANGPISANGPVSAAGPVSATGPASATGPVSANGPASTNVPAPTIRPQFASRDFDPQASPQHARVQLLTERASLAPGESLWAALEFQIDEHWHLYWRNPGDSGLPPSVRWTLPDGLEAGPLQWPVPKRLVEGELTTFAYETELVLPFLLRLDESAQAGQSLDLVGDLRWLVCRDLCESESGAVSSTLTVATGSEATGGEAPVASAGAPAIQSARNALPQLRPDWKLTLQSSGDSRVSLHLDWSTDPPKPGLEPADLFPIDELYDLTQLPRFRAIESGLEIELARSAGAGRAQTFSGLLTFQENDEAPPGSADASSYAVLLSTPPVPPDQP